MERPAEVEDASRRTRLCNERTYLAWWRTGMTAFAVALGRPDDGFLAVAAAIGLFWGSR